MNGLSAVFLVGQLKKDPMYSISKNGISVVRLSVEVSMNLFDKDGNNKSQVDMHDVIQFGKLADKTRDTLRAGDVIAIQGSLSKSSWLDESGVKQHRTDIKAQMISIISKVTE
jgi:single stranded DNA-binding protein